MRARARAFALVALGISPLACAVYQADQIPLLGDGDVGGSDSAGTAGSSPAVAGGGQINAAGTTSGAAGKATGGAPLGGSGGGRGGESPVPPMGGDASGGDTSEGGDAPGGTSNGGGGAGGASAGNSGTGGGGATTGGTGGGGSGGTGGNGGSGGAPAPTCADHALSPVSGWTASASHDNTGANPASNMLDGKTTRWTTGKAQTGDEWLQIDFGKSVSLTDVNLQQGNVDTNDYPRGYTVIVSDTSKDTSATPRLTGVGKTGASTPIALPKMATGRYLLVKQTGSSLSWWSMNEIEVSCSD